ncbi:alpha-glucuronidase [Desertivirga brevis]|uniref:alpha-glucuronidase n=1 Tax=Desertivirga brevis TaxID=2810310 RepID=UPI001A97130D|nr:alpha-glucuronidase [Pedobacter sp. SYSU D00873]
MLKIKPLLAKAAICFSIFLTSGNIAFADNGQELWLRKVQSNSVEVICKKKSPILSNAIEELQRGWQGKKGAKITLTISEDKSIKGDGFKLGKDGIYANTERGILYGVFELLRRQTLHQPVGNIVSNPSYDRRVLNHWDNLNGSIERGYAGRSIFWRGEKDLVVTPKDLELWSQYARANASIGINGSVLNNVNSSPRMLASENLKRVKAIADALRPFGVRTYLSVNFSSPAILGGLKTSDPLNPEVVKWWKNKAGEIYKLVPDFGGFLVKANSEGQPGPQDFGRTHAEGANMLADVLQPHQGIVMWRAFVYSSTDKDRARQAYNEFKPLDGQFRDNVIIQVKNGPIDFQPREPFSALFGAMEKTSVMPEFQVTQEYLGHSNHLVFLSTMWEECLKSDTYQKGKGSTVARCTDGSIFNQKHTAIAGVSNVGLDSNWTGHHFAQANWYAFGRLAWDNSLESEKVANEWLRLTFQPLIRDNNWEDKFVDPIKKMMLESREAAVNYSMPLGLHHIFSANHHYGPGPWWAPANVRVDWTPPYYHQASSSGIGFNRTKSGSDAVSQYAEPLASQLNDIKTCPEIYLLWFHHVSWDYKMKNGRTLWDELCYHYDRGVQQVRDFQKTWDKVEAFVDPERFHHVQSRLKVQARDAEVWKDGCLLYFQQFSKRPVPYELERPVYELKFLQTVNPMQLTGKPSSEEWMK